MTEKISILTPLHNDDLSLYKIAVESLAKTCTDFDKVELMVKVDSLKSKKNTESLLKNYDFKFTVVYNKLRGYQHFGEYFNQMIERSSGCLFLSFCADCEIQGDWVKEFLSTRGRYKDNIYVVNTRPRSYWTFQPLFSIEWYRVFKRITPKGCPSVDTWLRDLASKVGRYITIPNSQVNIIIKRREVDKSRIGKHRRNGRRIMRQNLGMAIKKLKKAIG